MAKINLLVLERENNIRTSAEFERERDLMKYLFENHKNSMIIRHDAVDAMLTQNAKDKVFGSALNKVLDGVPGKTIYNFATSKCAGFTLLGIIETLYANAGTKETKEWSGKLDDILEVLDKTAALLGREMEKANFLNTTFEDIRNNFIKLDIGIGSVNPAVNKLTTGGIPEMTIVLSTTAARKEFDIKAVKEDLHKILVKPVLNIANISKKINTKSFKDELINLAEAKEEAYNECTLSLVDDKAKSEVAIKEYIEKIEAENNSILEVLYVFNAIMKSEPTQEFMSNACKLDFSKIANIADLIKLLCTI